MPNLPISGLTASASNAAATDVLPVVQTTGTGPVKMTVQQMAGGLLGSTTLSGATITADAPVLNMSQTWNNGAVTFTGLKFNATDTASAASSLLLDVGTGGGTYVSKFKVAKDGKATFAGNIVIPNTGQIGSLDNVCNIYFNNGAAGRFLFGSGSAFCFEVGGTDGAIGVSSGGSYGWTSSATSGSGTRDLFLTRRAAANLRLGAADAAAPVAQTLSVQSITGTNASAAAYPFTITGAQGTGTGAGGSIIFQVAPAGGTSNAVQNALATALTINSDRTVAIGGLTIDPGNGATTFLQTFAITMQTSNAFVIRHGNNDGLDVRPVSSGSPNIQLKNASNAIQAGLWGEATNTLALRNGNNGQTFRLYGRFTDITNDFERFFIEAPTTSGAAVLLGTQKGATTGAARALEFQTDGTTRLTIGSTGIVTVNSATLILGETGVLRTRYINNGNNYVSMFDFVADATGTATFALGGSAPLMRFGGTDATFPALKRSSTTLIVRLANDTANAALESASLKTDAPAGGTAATWKLGTVASVSPTSPNRTIEVDIGGTIYYLHAKTTND